MTSVEQPKPHLFTLEEGIENKTGIGKHVLRVSVRLLHTARVWQVSLAQAGIRDIVVRAIRRAVRVCFPEVRGRRVGEVIINCARQRSVSKSRTRIQQED